MTEQEIIQALKENEAGYCLLSSELKKFIGRMDKNSLVWLTVEGKWESCTLMPGGIILQNQIIRLRYDYPENTEIELEIKEGNKGLVILDIRRMQEELYTSAPALIPKEGYRFVGYKYDDGAIELCSTMYDVDGDKSIVIFPISAVYEKEKS